VKLRRVVLGDEVLVGRLLWTAGLGALSVTFVAMAWTSQAAPAAFLAGSGLALVMALWGAVHARSRLRRLVRTLEEGRRVPGVVSRVYRSLDHRRVTYLLDGECAGLEIDREMHPAYIRRRVPLREGEPVLFAVDANPPDLIRELGLYD
jgi:hypothetical protein